MEKTKYNGKLAIGIILIILGVGLATIAAFRFCNDSIYGHAEWQTYSPSRSGSTPWGYNYDWDINNIYAPIEIYDNSFWIEAAFYLIFSVLFISVGSVLIAQYTAYKKEIAQQQTEKMIAEKYGVQVSIPASKPQIVNCNNCNAEIECYENQPIITCSKCGKAYKNPYYKEK